MHYSDKMVRIEDIVFWIIIIAIIAIAIWLLRGSPPETNALISIALFVAASELMLWKTLFKIDKNTSIGFVKVKNDMNNKHLEINNRFDKIEGKLDKIEEKLK